MIENPVTGEIKLNVEGDELTLRCTVTGNATTVDAILPAARNIADAFVALAEAQVSASGAQVSCKKGCGACCRQLVPISASEARDIVRLIAALPADRRAEIERRFDSAHARLARAGMLPRLLQPEGITAQGAIEFGVAYFKLGIPCPFLENESCSIHAERPVVCREYLVVSDPVHCESPDPATIQRIRIVAKPAHALRQAEGYRSTRPPAAVALSVAPFWVQRHSDSGPELPGPDWLKRMLEALLDKSVATPPLPGLD